jgi:hypothetical protein
MAKMVEPMRLRAAAALPLIAFGVIAGVSFLAQPAKFLTPGLALADLVSVGSTLFVASHAVHLGILLLLSFFVPDTKDSESAAWALLGAIALALVVQHFFMMPRFEERLCQLRQGLPLAPSLLHGAYVALEIVKLASLLWLAGLSNAGHRQSVAAGATE